MDRRERISFAARSDRSDQPLIRFEIYSDRLIMSALPDAGAPDEQNALDLIETIRALLVKTQIAHEVMERKRPGYWRFSIHQKRVPDAITVFLAKQDLPRQAKAMTAGPST